MVFVYKPKLQSSSCNITCRIGHCAEVVRVPTNIKNNNNSNNCNNVNHSLQQQYKNSMIIFGGSYGNSFCSCDEIYNLDLETLDTQKWSITNTKQDFSMPQIRRCKTALVDDYMYLFGGWDGSTTHDTLYRLHLHTLKWEILKTQIGSAFTKIIPSNNNNNNNLINNNNNNNTPNSINNEEWYRFDPFTEDMHYLTEVSLTSTGPSPRSGSSLNFSAGYLWLFAGRSGIYQANRYDGLYRLDPFHPSTISSQEFNNNNNNNNNSNDRNHNSNNNPIYYKWDVMDLKGTPSPRNNHDAVSLGLDHLFILGGANSQGEVEFLSDAFVFNTVTMEWHQLNPTGVHSGPGGICAHTIHAVGPQSVAVLLGSCEHDNNDLWLASIDLEPNYTLTWQPLDITLDPISNPKLKRWGHQSCLVDTGTEWQAIVFGGIQNDDQGMGFEYLNDVLVLEMNEIQRSESQSQFKANVKLMWNN